MEAAVATETPKPYQHDEAQADESRTEAKFRAVFRTPDGQEVLQNLRELAHGLVKNDDQPWRVIGRHR